MSEQDQLEILRMQLAACGVAALANTSYCAEKMRNIHNEYKSGSWESVCDAVDREMALRDQRDLLFAALKDITEVAELCDGWSSFPTGSIERAQDAISAVEGDTMIYCISG